MNDELGNRIKDQYENRTKTFLPRRTFTIIRLDGKAFHTYTKGLNKPFDYNLIADMDNATIAIMAQIQGAQFAYVQSDEISILLTDFEKLNTDAWFDGNIQKITSVSASLITAEFNKLRIIRSRNNWGGNKINGEFPGDETLAYFDSRVFTIPDRIEVMNYFIWRNQDCARNSVSMVAQSLYSHKELHEKSNAEKQELIFQKTGINWANYKESDKNGRLIIKETYTPELPNVPLELKDKFLTRTRWISRAAWKFTEDKEKLLNLIPNYN